MKNNESITLNKQEALQNTGELSEELLERVQGGSGQGNIGGTILESETKSPGEGVAKWRNEASFPAPSTSGVPAQPVQPGPVQVPYSIHIKSSSQLV
jgi:hypothetical protein